MDKKNLLANSVEFRYNRNCFLIVLMITLLFLLVSTICSINVKEIKFFYVGLISSIPLIVICLFYAYRMFYLFHKIDTYKLAEVDFLKFTSAWRSMYFTVNIKIENDTLRKFTNSIFNSSSLSNTRAELFINKKVLIAYKEDEEKVIVLKIIGTI